MSNTLKMHTHKALRTAIAFTPWLISCYTLYWLQYGEVWTTATAHRGKTSVAILAVGMGLSFLIQSRFAKSEEK